MSRQLEDTLVEALDLLEQGTPVVRILAAYPEMADELRPYLLLAADLKRTAEPAPAAAAQASKHAFLQEAALLQEGRRPPAAAGWLRRILAYGLAALLFLFMGSAILAFSAGEALPGDTLYGAKLFLEAVRLNYSADPTAAAAMIESFYEERVEEVAALLAAGRHEQVTFSGTVEDMAPEEWLVEGLRVAIAPATLISDPVEVGIVVRVSGVTADGVVAADEVEVMNGRLPEPAPVDPLPPPKPSPSPVPSAVPADTPARPDDEPESDPPALITPPLPTDEDHLPGGDDVEQEDGGNAETPPAGEDGDDPSEEGASESSLDDVSDDGDSGDEGSRGEGSDDESNEQAEDEEKEDSAGEDESDEDRGDEDKSDEAEREEDGEEGG